MVKSESRDASDNWLRNDIGAVIGSTDSDFKNCSINFELEEDMIGQEGYESKISRFRGSSIVLLLLKS